MRRVFVSGYHLRMTTTSHTGHDHPATPAGRRACRALIAASNALAATVRTGDSIVFPDGRHVLVMNVYTTAGWPAEFQIRESGVTTGWVVLTAATISAHHAREM